MVLLYLLLVTLFQLFQISHKGRVPQVEQKLHNNYYRDLYEQQNIILGSLYSVTGSGIQHDGSSISTPAATSVSETINGTTHTWQGLNLDQRPNWTQTNQGDAFQFTEVYQAPWNGIRNRYNPNHRKHKRHRYHNYLLAISLVGNPVFANMCQYTSST